MFRLVYGDYDVALPLIFDVIAEERLIAEMSFAREHGPEKSKLARRITDAIADLLDCHFPPPTTKQLLYAAAIARELSLTLSPQVLQSREEMTAFLGIHAQTYRKRKGRA